VPESRASGSTVKTRLRANTGPTIEMSPRVLARASRPFMAATSTADTTIASHAAPPGVTKDSPDTAKNASHATTATSWVEATPVP